RQWLEVQGFGVVETGWTRSQLVSRTIDLAKQGHAMNPLTFNLLYATDFADRLEKEIIPSLKSGFIVLADRYIYTAIARAEVRGVDMTWIRDLFGFAIQPDLVMYMKIGAEALARRVIRSHGLDYWEAGLDHSPGSDPYDSFLKYQRRLLREFNKLADEYGFEVINAARSVGAIQRELRRRVAQVIGADPEAGPPIPRSH
ncbi:MAG: thymidylate kinase, partial [Candidatus Latescibacteria bacterium]|nr:thymidylate kinase [Candidatus Latescibacterota bacterium]